MVEFYKRGNWIIGTPIYPLASEDLEARMQAMSCPHCEYKEVDRTVEEIDGEEYIVVKEECPECPAIRMRLFPTDLPEEPYDPTPPAGPWWERLYNFGNFTILVRRHTFPGRPPYYLTRIDTAGGNAHAGFHPGPNDIFAPAALHQLQDLERMLKLGPERYVSFRALKERLTRKAEKDDLIVHAKTLFPVAQEIGPEGVAAARDILEREVDNEIAEMEEFAAAEMERQAEEMKKQAEEIRKRKKK